MGYILIFSSSPLYTSIKWVISSRYRFYAAG